MEEKGLDSWDYKSNEEKAKEVEGKFGEDVVDAEVVEEGKEMEKEKEEEKKEETIEEKKERVIDILLGIGFQRSKDKGDGKLRFYYKIDDNSAVGRTFQKEYPTGKFWAKKQDKFLTEDECKQMEIVKKFYAIRDGKEKMPERPKEMAKREEKEQEQRATAMMIKPNAVIQDAQKKADMLYSVVEKQHLYQEIKGKKYLQLEAWQTLGKFCNVTGEIEWVKPVEMWDARGFEARAVIKTIALEKDEEGTIIVKVGDTIAAAESMTMTDEENWADKPMFQLKSMSQTRALSKAYRSCLSFIVALAGYQPTPAEEM